jgi:hypothetical protein
MGLLKSAFQATKRAVDEGARQGRPREGGRSKRAAWSRAPVALLLCAFGLLSGCASDQAEAGDPAEAGSPVEVTFLGCGGDDGAFGTAKNNTTVRTTVRVKVDYFLDGVVVQNMSGSVTVGPGQTGAWDTIWAPDSWDSCEIVGFDNVDG